MAEKKKTRRNETITVMLIPSTHGRPVQFQTSKRVLLGLIGAGAASFVLLIVFISMWSVGKIAEMRHEEQLQAQESEALIQARSQARHYQQLHREAEAEQLQIKLRYDELKHVHQQYAENTEAKIGSLRNTISKIAAFTGLPLDAQTTPTIEIDEPGKGGPLTKLMELSTPEIRSQFVISKLQRLELHLQQLELMEHALENAYGHLARQEKLLLRTPLIVPIKGSYMITDRYGSRTHPIFKRKDFHSGLDFGASAGTPIIAPADGVVAFTGVWKKKPGYGKLIRIDHGAGMLFEEDGSQREVSFRTRFAHCREIQVKEGQKVKRGEVIGTVGSTGYSTGNHLHYEVLIDNENVDPERFVLNLQ